MNASHARRPHFPKRGIKARFEFKLPDLWIGAFWKREQAWSRYPWDRIHLWVCVVPCFPFHISWDTMPTDPEGGWS